MRETTTINTSEMHNGEGLPGRGGGRGSRFRRPSQRASTSPTLARPRGRLPRTCAHMIREKTVWPLREAPGETRLHTLKINHSVAIVSCSNPPPYTRSFSWGAHLMVDAVAYLEQRSTADEQAGSRHLTWPKKADLIGNQRKMEKNDAKERWICSS
jgi:hypothetical protein